MNAQMLLQSFAGGDEEKTYIEDVFSTYLYDGNGTSQTITNGIDLAGKGGLVWTKARSAAIGNGLHDTARGAGKLLQSDSTGAQVDNISVLLSSFNSDGFTVKSNNAVNQSGTTYASWTFRKAKKFFDVVTWTGDGTLNRVLNHSLGISPGMILVKNTKSSGQWGVGHVGLTGGFSASGNSLRLNTTDAQLPVAYFPAVSATTFTQDGNYNVLNETYVAYLFAHDPSADGIIQCGSYTGNGGVKNITLGWEPQFLLIKSTTSTDVNFSNWYLMDMMRGMEVNTVLSGNYAKSLNANNSSAETNGYSSAHPTATGFELNNGSTADNQSGQTYIYLAIRRGPMRVPTDGTKVFKAGVRAGDTAPQGINALFAPDLYVGNVRSNGMGYTYNGPQWFDKLRGGKNVLCSAGDYQEYAQGEFSSYSNVGVTVADDSNGGVYVAGGTGVYSFSDYLFRRAPGFFDIVCDTGSGAAHAINHSLTVAPELIIRKSRSRSTQWECWHSALAATEKLVLNSTAAKTTDATAFGTLPTATTFYVGTSANTNTSAANYVTYLFATCPGVSKVGYYTGNGTSLQIECGFASGARFILVKSVDDAGDWFIWDTARGIVAANDPHLSLNTTAAEVTTDDSVDQYAGGFIVNQNTATNININGKRYIFLAIA